MIILMLRVDDEVVVQVLIAEKLMPVGI